MAKHEDTRQIYLFPIVRQIGLTELQRRILAVMPLVPVTCGEIARRLGRQSPSAMSGPLRRLEERGLVRQEPDGKWMRLA